MVAHTLRSTKFKDLPIPTSSVRLAEASASIDTIGASAYATSAGVNIFACLRGQFGLAESARMYSLALLEAGYPVALNDIDIDAPHVFDDRSLDDHIGTNAPYGINLIFVNPDYLAPALASINNAKMEGRYVIACWFWELERIPDNWLWALNHVDEIMVASNFVEKAFRKVTDKPILRVPIPISCAGDSGLTRRQFGLAPNKFVFLNTFDFNSWWCRKNPFSVIKAFRNAFPTERRDVQLLIKSINGHRQPEKLMHLVACASVDDRIIVRDEVLDRRDMHALQRCTDAYISLHRAEGFGLGLAECMAMGKPVVGTGWSGNLDYMTQDNSCLVNYRLVPVGDEEYPHSDGAMWAEADIEHASALMKRIVDEPLFAQALGAKASEDTQKRLSPRAVAGIIAARLDEIAMKRTLFSRVEETPMGGENATSTWS